MDRARKAGALQEALASLAPIERTGRHGIVPLGADRVDAALGGGLARGAVHEIFPAQAGDIAAAAGFMTGLVLRVAPQTPLVWIRQRRVEQETGYLYPHGLNEMGLRAGDVVVVTVETIAEGLRAGLEALRCTGLGAVVLEIWGSSRHLDLTASRRLALAAGETGVTGVILQAQAAPQPSAASTRWQVEATASADPHGLVGLASFSLILLRQRGGMAGGNWHLEWNHERKIFAHTPLSGGLAAPVFDRQARPYFGAKRAGAR